MNTALLERFLDDTFGDRASITVTPMVGGGSCEVFALDRGPSRWYGVRPATPAPRPHTTCCASSASSMRFGTNPS